MKKHPLELYYKQALAEKKARKLQKIKDKELAEKEQAEKKATAAKHAAFYHATQGAPLPYSLEAITLSLPIGTVLTTNEADNIDFVIGGDFGNGDEWEADVYFAECMEKD